VDLGPAPEELGRQGVDLDRLAVDHRLVGVAQLDGGRGGVDPHVRRAERCPVVVAVVPETVCQLAGLP
jgi:hypothetical protein